MGNNLEQGTAHADEVKDAALDRETPLRSRRADGPTPRSNRLVGYGAAALAEQSFTISDAHADAMVEPHGLTDHFGQDSVSVVAERVAGHRPTSPATAST